MKQILIIPSNIVSVKELRIGNLVQDVGVLEKELTVYKLEDGIITCGDDSFSYPYLSKHLQGIPITPEWLERFGFEYIDIVLYSWANENHMCYEHKEGGFVFMPFCTNDEDCHIRVLYLHQLQNLYYSLTGHDLTINETK